MRIILNVCLALGVSLPSLASAEFLSTKSQKNVFKSQTSVLDNRANQQYKNSVRLKPQTINTPTKWDFEVPNDLFKSKYKGVHLHAAKDAARRHGIATNLFLKLVQQESAWNAKALSPKGAIGLAQLMPGTARGLGVDPHDPKQNLEGGARYLAKQYKTFGSWPLALAAYNAGPGAVKKYGGIPPFKETKNYVRVIWGG